MTTVLFATEYDTANIVVNILSRSATEHQIFPLIVRHRSSNTVNFALQTQKCTDSVRTGIVLVCDDRRLRLSKYLATNEPIPSSAIQESLDEERTRQLYEHTFTPTSHQNGQITEFRHLIYFHRSAVIRHLNTTFIAPTSPSWFLSTFGASEGLLLLTLSYYLFERQYSTIQTTRDYVRCFTEDLGHPLFTYISMRDFMTTLLTSRFRHQTTRFSTYAKNRNRRDREELRYVDEQINEFREETRLPTTSCVHYVYLAYRTALSKPRLLTYCDVVAYDPDLNDDEQCAREPGYLGRSLRQELISVMETYFSLRDYFRTYVDITVSPPHPDVTCRGYAFDARSPQLAGYFATSSNVAGALSKINTLTEGLFTPVPESIHGLLKTCASEKSVTTTHGLVRRRDYLFKTKIASKGPFPVFRVEMPDRQHIFCVIGHENWYRSLFPQDLLNFIPNEYVSDETLTDAVWLPETIVSSRDVKEQLYRTRHELFNESLPVFNFVGDFDLKLKPHVDGLEKRLFFDLCRYLRRALIRSWNILFPQIDTDAHPVYFFKTSCSPPTIDQDDLELAAPTQEPRFCSCRDKLGLRIIIPFPRDVAALGSATLRSMAKILDHAICLDRDLATLLNEIAQSGDCFDHGIYRNGHSVRMPYMYKLDRDNGLLMHGRLNPVFIVPESRKNDPAGFVRDQMCPYNLLHHARNPRDDHPHALLINIRDTGCPEHSNFIEGRIATSTHREKPQLRTVIGNHLSTAAMTADAAADDAADSEDLQTFIRQIAWPSVLEQIRRHYSESVKEQFEQHITFIATGQDRVALKRLDGGRLKDFRCLTRYHRILQETVQVFLDVKTDHRHAVWITLWSRCFTKRCNSNAKQTHLSVKIDPPARY